MIRLRGTTDRRYWTTEQVDAAEMTEWHLVYFELPPVRMARPKGAISGHRTGASEADID